MCRHAHIRLTAEERKSVGRWTGILVPAYASVALLLLLASLISFRPGDIALVAEPVVANAVQSGPAGLDAQAR